MNAELWAQNSSNSIFTNSYDIKIVYHYWDRAVKRGVMWHFIVGVAVLAVGIAIAEGAVAVAPRMALFPPDWHDLLNLLLG